MKRAERIAVRRDIRRRKACTKHHPPREKDTMAETTTNEVRHETTEHHEIQIQFPGEERWFAAERRVSADTGEASLAVWRSGAVGNNPPKFRLAKITTWTEIETEVLEGA